MSEIGKVRQPGRNTSVPSVQFDGTLGPLGKQIVPGRIPVDLALTFGPFELARLPEIAGPLPVGITGVLSASEKIKGSVATGIIFDVDATLEKLNITDKSGVPLVTGFDGSVAEKGRMDLGKDLVTLESFSLKAYQAVFDASGTVRGVYGTAMGTGTMPTVDLQVKSPVQGEDGQLLAAINSVRKPYSRHVAP